MPDTLERKNQNETHKLNRRPFGPSLGRLWPRHVVHADVAPVHINIYTTHADPHRDKYSGTHSNEYVCADSNKGLDGWDVPG